MAINNPYTAYHTTRTVTAGKTQLLVMLHDAAIRFLAQAAAATREKDYQKKSINFNNAMNIVDHLLCTLDKEEGGEIAANLERVYSYMHDRLIVANATDDLAIIKEAMTHLREIRGAWAQVGMLEKTTPSALPTRQLGEALSAAA